MSLVEKRSVTIRGHRTSYSLEKPFYDDLLAIATERGIALAALVAEVDETRPREANLSSALRLHVLEWAKQRTKNRGGRAMYGLIGRMIAQPGKRDELISIMTESSDAMPGCLSYVIATDPADDNAIWITEVWDNETSHKASLSLAAVQAAIARARPLIAGFDNRTETRPVSGYGLPGKP
ncbi:Predicted DNA-binding protein, contains Ribbon-helix-helix (RHH) domain [Mesorhizobium sp. YR577]|nr:Predicted DNA-binding protein, contains Ribbon-helix-helix (RHH) domain [Mesorhizobium sp. YR577]